MFFFIRIKVLSVVAAHKMFLINNNFLILLSIFFNYGIAFRLKLGCDSPIVKGATLNCTTWVLTDDGTLADGTFKYIWRDDAIPPNDRELESGPSTDTWLITYNNTRNTAGSYVIRVQVCEWALLGLYCRVIDSIGTFFEITDALNGDIVLHQSNETRNAFVSTSSPIKNTIVLKKSDHDYISKAPTVLSYWFVDCVYYGITTDFQFEHNFKKADEEHLIEALVVGDFTPLPPPTTVPPSTTTSKPTSSTTKASTTTKKSAVTTRKPSVAVTNTTTKPQITLTAHTSAKSKREATSPPSSTNSTSDNKNNTSNETQSNIKIWQNGALVPYNGSFPYVCNSTFITTDSSKVYGYFHKTVTTKAPVSNITVSGNNWLQHGELLSLNIKCQGSDKMQYCLIFKPGVYNTTGRETCDRYDDLDRCDFPIKRYFGDTNKHTVLIIIKNDVSKTITPVTVTVYKVKQQAQLSVIVVPVAFSLVAVVTIVFGVAYYIQNRSRFIVEVADFDFGQQYADMEYKTFKDRLKDSITNAFMRDSMPSTSDQPIWPPGHKYGSMT